MARSPMRIFESTLSNPTRYYVTQAYRFLLTKDPANSRIVVTGKKHDVTDQIEEIVQRRIAELQNGKV